MRLSPRRKWTLAVLLILVLGGQLLAVWRSFGTRTASQKL